MPVTGAVNVLDAKSPFWSYTSVPKTTVVVALVAISAWTEAGVAKKAGCNGLVM